MMLRGAAIFSIFGLLTAVLSAPDARAACQCQSSYAPCNEAAVSDVVFIGTVESISPIFLSRWSTAGRASLPSLNEAYREAQDHPSAAALARLIETYLGAFPDLSPGDKQALREAKTIYDVTSVFSSTMNSGMTVRFKAGTIFKNEDDDDDKDEAAAEKDFEVSTPFGDCGVEFQIGETYLVYANNDEHSGRMFTTACSRTRRLTDAGDDLAYLYFYKERHSDKEGRGQSARIEGFATADVQYQLSLDRMHDPVAIKSPVPGVILELRSEGLARYATSDGKGKFVFDGLGAGEYVLSAFDRQYPVKQNLLAGPRKFSLAPRGCALQVLLLPAAR
jgi:hypothetical protein